MADNYRHTYDDFTVILEKKELEVCQSKYLGDGYYQITVIAKTD